MRDEEICESLTNTGVTTLLGVAALVFLIHGSVIVLYHSLTCWYFDSRRIRTVSRSREFKVRSFLVKSEPFLTFVQILDHSFIGLF